jgi:hypothetical protein
MTGFLYEAGWGGILLGLVVLASYVARRTEIEEAAKPLLKRRIMFCVWLVSALITASSFLGVVWVYSRGELTKLTFVVGMYIFMAGAISWPWTLRPLISPLEVASLITTAIGSSLLLIGSIHEAGSTVVIFTGYIFFHHLVVDGIWWPAYGRS